MFDPGIRACLYAVGRLSVAVAVGTVLSLGPAAQMGVASSLIEPHLQTQVTFAEEANLEEQLNVPVYHWFRPGTPVKSIVVMLHGVAMHGTSFDVTARTLVEQGSEVFATDMRGYGRCKNEYNHEFCLRTAHGDPDCKQKMNYERSFEDLQRLTERVRMDHPDVPLFAAGESLGGAMMIRLAAERKDLVDGLILSAPAIKHHSFVDSYTVTNAGLVMTNPRAQLDLKHFIKSYASDDPRVVDEALEDELVRRHISFYELMSSANCVRKCFQAIPNIPAETPVLVVQGSADRCCRANAVVLLLERLKSTDQTVKWFHKRGHILIETSYVKQDTLDTIISWVNDHSGDPVVLEKLQQKMSIKHKLDKPDLALLSRRAHLQGINGPLPELSLRIH